jgi:hypothetical protein
MRATFSAFLLLLLTACGPATEPATAPSAVPPPPPVTPTDRQESDDPTVNFIRKHQAIIDDLFTTGMLQQKNVQYNCNGLRGTAEVHRKDGEVRLVRNRYNDGDNRTITDRFYYKDGELIHQFSETLRWEFDGTTQKDQNGNAVPGIINHIARYRYYIRGGKVLTFLKRKFDFSSLEVQPAEENFPLLKTTPPAELPYRTNLAQAAIEEGKVDCSVFQ